MLLTIDIGNTNSVFGLYNQEYNVQDVLKKIWRIKTDRQKTSDEYAVILLQLFQAENLKFSDVTDIIVSSVVPETDFEMKRLFKTHFGCNVVFLSNRMLSPLMDIKIDRPEELGADRLVNALAAKFFYQIPAIIVDFGTATTFDVVDREGVHIGGVIAPGVNLSMKALADAASKLPRIDIRAPSRAIGKNTVDAMSSGIYWGYVGLIEGILKRLVEEMGETPYVIATGGLASLYLEHCPGIHAIDEDLTQKGLCQIHKLLKEKQ